MTAQERHLTGVAKRSVLIVDDDLDLHSFLTMVLEGQGYLVVSALGASQGLDLVQLLEPDLVLLDADIPGGDVLNICQAVSAPRNAPAIILLAEEEPNETDWEMARGAGIDDIVVKPFDVDDLIARAAGLVKDRRDILLQ